MNSKTHFCPRCKQDRMREWFGDPKAPYAICLSCRVEVNGEKKRKTPKVIQKQANCAICARLLDKHDQDLCVRCQTGLSYFQNDPRLLGRAASYVTGKLRKSKAKGRREKRCRQNTKLQQLITDQAHDRNDRHLRFDHAVSKR